MIAAEHSDRVAGRKAFTLHFFEMVLVMFVGMGIFSGVAALALLAFGGSIGDLPGAARVTMMGVNMTLPMVIWMTLRGHSAARNVEMAAAMMVPTLVAAALVGAGALDVMMGLTVQHVVMVPAMLAVMLWRYDEYAHSHSTASA